LPRAMTGRRWGFRRRNNKIFINVDIDPGWLGLRHRPFLWRRRPVLDFPGGDVD
jgi:hypothetical protein